jgi:hypothetical protein
MEAVYTEKYKGLTIEIHSDSDCESPLENDEGVFITHRRNARECFGNTPLDQDEHEEIAKNIESGELIGLPVYAYVHSGVAEAERFLASLNKIAEKV